MSVFDKKHLDQARAEGRVCERCGWMITKKRWASGKHLCFSCEDALKGVNVKGGYYPYQDEPPEKTGNTT